MPPLLLVSNRPPTQAAGQRLSRVCPASPGPCSALLLQQLLLVVVFVAVVHIAVIILMLLLLLGRVAVLGAGGLLVGRGLIVSGLAVVALAVAKHIHMVAR